jgi:hypothetical protein
MKVLEWICKLISFPLFIVGLVVSMPCLEFLFWLDDNREMKWKALRHVKQCFLDIIEGVRDYWNDNIPMKD